MKRYPKVLIILILAFLLSLMVAGAASADVIRGEGWLHARDAGGAVLKMSGDIDITGHGVGVIYIYGADAIDATGQGQRIDHPGGVVVFRGHSGTIAATGDNMIVKIVGGKIDFTAQGQGTVYLRGKGHYETIHAEGDWATDGNTLAVTEE